MRGDVGRSAIIIWTARTCEAAAQELVVQLGLVESVRLRLLDGVQLLLELRDAVHAERAVHVACSIYSPYIGMHACTRLRDAVHAERAVQLDLAQLALELAHLPY